jgi:hypothetical protein
LQFLRHCINAVSSGLSYPAAAAAYLSLPPVYVLALFIRH